MTATSYVVLDNDDLGANKIFRAATASALDTNPVSIAQRGTGAPWLNGVGAIKAITSGSGNWTVPDGVYRIKVTAVGSGGGVSGSAASVFGSITGGAGNSGGAGPSGGAGGSGSGGDINMTGEAGGVTGEEYFRSMSMVGGLRGSGSQFIPLTGVGGGGAGGTAIKCMSVEPGDLIAYSTGGNGIIIIEY